MAALGNYPATVEPLQGAARLKLSQPRSGRDACATSKGVGSHLDVANMGAKLVSRFDSYAKVGHHRRETWIDRPASSLQNG